MSRKSLPAKGLRSHHAQPPVSVSSPQPDTSRSGPAAAVPPSVWPLTGCHPTGGVGAKGAGKGGGGSADTVCTVDSSTVTGMQRRSKQQAEHSCELTEAAAKKQRIQQQQQQRQQHGLSLTSGTYGDITVGAANSDGSPPSTDDDRIPPAPPATAQFFEMAPIEHVTFSDDDHDDQSHRRSRKRVKLTDEESNWWHEVEQMIQINPIDQDQDTPEASSTNASYHRRLRISRKRPPDINDTQLP